MQDGEVRSFHVWEEHSLGKPMQADVWLPNFPPEMTVNGESFPVGTFAVAGNSHNRAPKQTLMLMLRDTVHGSQAVQMPFASISGGYQPVGAAHVLLHRDYSDQPTMLKVIAGNGYDLVRIYTWWYLVEHQYRWSEQLRQWLLIGA